MDKARDVLVGVIPDPKGQVEQITAALMYKYLDGEDEKSAAVAGGKRTFFVGKYAKYAWQKLLSPSIVGDQRLTLYKEAMESMADNTKLPPIFCDMLHDAHSPFRDARVLGLFLKAIDELDCNHTEDLGDAYEYLLSIMGTQGDAGQFRTPRHIIDFIVEVIKPQTGERVLDPACGSAGFLVSAHNFIMENNKNIKRGDLLTQSQRRNLPKHIAGRDIDPGMTRLALVNLYLHGIKEPQVKEYDSLSDDSLWDERHDIILANPPFMTPRGGIQPHKKFAVRANRAEVLFVDYIAEHLSRQGRAGIIVPEGIIFQSGNAYKELRRQLINEWGLFAVVSLPPGVFNPYSGVKTSILFLDKTKREHTHILFAKVQNDGFDLGAKRHPIDKNDLPDSLKIICDYKDEKSVNNPLAQVVAKTKIAEDGDYNFNGDRYKEMINYKNVQWNIVVLGELEKEGKVKFLRGQGISKKDIIENGKNKCIHYGEIYTLYEPIIKEVVSKTNLEGKILSCKGDVLLPSTTTADAAGIAVARSLNKENVILGGDINIVRTENKHVLSDFLALLISYPPLKLALASFAKGANILHISNSDIRKLRFPLPPIEVQKQIVSEIDGYAKVRDGAKTVVDNWKPIINISPDWKIVKLGDALNINFGERITKREHMGSKYPVYGGGGESFRTDQYNRENSYVTSRFAMSENCVRFVIGKFWLMDSGFTVSVKKEFSQKLNKEFIGIVFMGMQKNIFCLSRGHAQKNLDIKSFLISQIPLPPIKIQEKIVAEIEAEQQAISECRILIDKMEAKIAATIGRIWENKA